MLPSILKNNSISEEGEENGSRLFNVAELEADYVNDNNWSWDQGKKEDPNIQRKDSIWIL